MRPVIVTPDVELWATGWLREQLAARGESYASDVFVANSVPSTRRDRMVIVRRDGGPRADLLHTVARLTVNVWAKSTNGTEQDVINLARLVEGLLLSVSATAPVESVTSQAGPIAVADESGVPRRFFTVEAVVRGSVSN